jgi:hypothetical protein
MERGVDHFIPGCRSERNAAPKLGSPRMKDSVQASQTVLMGDLVLGSTLWKNLCPGIPPSRAKAYIMRELDVTENTLMRGKRHKVA